MVNSYYVVLRSNTQAVEFGASDVLERCLYWGNLFLILGIICAQLPAVWGFCRVECEDQGVACAGLLTDEIRVITNKRMIET